MGLKMKRFKNIMVLDWSFQSNDALEHAITVAKQHNAALKIFEVVDSLNDSAMGPLNHLVSCNPVSISGRQHDQNRHESLYQIHNSNLRVECK